MENHFEKVTLLWPIDKIQKEIGFLISSIKQRFSTISLEVFSKENSFLHISYFVSISVYSYKNDIYSYMKNGRAWVLNAEFTSLIVLLRKNFYIIVRMLELCCPLRSYLLINRSLSLYTFLYTVLVDELVAGQPVWENWFERLWERSNLWSLPLASFITLSLVSRT